MPNLTVIILVLIGLGIPLAILFLIVKSSFSLIRSHRVTVSQLTFIPPTLKELGVSMIIIVVLIFMGIHVGLIPLSIFGMDYQSGKIRLDENGNPDCTPYSSPWGMICE